MNNIATQVDRPRDEQDEALRAVLEASLAKLTPKNRKPPAERRRKTSKPTPRKVKTAKVRKPDPAPYREVTTTMIEPIDWAQVRYVTVFASVVAPPAMIVGGALLASVMGTWAALAWPISSVVVGGLTVWGLGQELSVLFNRPRCSVTERVIDTDKVCYGPRGGAFTYRSDGSKKRIKARK